MAIYCQSVLEWLKWSVDYVLFMGDCVCVRFVYVLVLCRLNSSRRNYCFTMALCVSITGKAREGFTYMHLHVLYLAAETLAR